MLNTSDIIPACNNFFSQQVEETVENTSVLTELFCPQWSELSTVINIQLELYIIDLRFALKKKILK